MEFSVDKFYDITKIEKDLKRVFRNSIIKIFIETFFLLAGIIAVIIAYNDMRIFVSGIALTIIFSLLLAREWHKVHISRLGSWQGVIIQSIYEIKTYNVNKTASYSLQHRKYDSYLRSDGHLTLYIECDGKTRIYHIPLANEEHAEYYKQGLSVVHPYGTKFPIIQGAERKICLVCGEFLESDVTKCSKCKMKLK